MSRLRNATGHDLWIAPNGSAGIVIPAERGLRVRLTEQLLDVLPEDVEAPNGGRLEVPVGRVHYGRVAGLPPARHGVLVVVSGRVLDAIDPDDRPDLRAPHDLLRDARGRTIGCRTLRRAVTA